MPSTRPVTIEIQVDFRAPLPFVFSWCTDYDPRDPKIEGGSYERRVISRTDKAVVYEDLDSAPSGWRWSHWDVSLRPPDRWHGVAVGNYRNWVTDYRLREVAPGRTVLTLKGRRTSAGLGGASPSRAEIERNLRADWKKLAAALEADFRRSKPTGRGRPDG